jgi:hypothetical protein
LTVRYVYEAKTEAEFATRVHAWAQVVWKAYTAQHELARSWIRQATGG